ncbi:MAG: hypothetical protein KC427_00385 [Sulfurovum sp.]|uniref:hypothetical protein n=1 Tax=Sulfurovum sp. TaxID=1969726 RepID=UPI002867E869|nr:hypothetical protein [Sulfurovum sp.]MCO4844453.1 hypothetical protein [Sulfurovum sp.]
MMELSLKIAKYLTLLCLTVPLIAIEHDVSIENTNYTISKVPYSEEDRTLYNYNRLRLTDKITEGNWFATIIADIDNYYGKDYIESFEYQFLRGIKADTPFDIETNAKNYGKGEIFGRLHRFNVGYGDEKHNVIFGLQKITMGVGRIWTPTDLFNPRNPLALEPDQIYGNVALSYTYALGELSEVMGVVAKRDDNSYKYAGRIKGNIEIVDIALDVYSSNDAKMVAYEIEGNLFDTGIEWRSEGGYYKDKLLDKEFYQTILGMDYGFVNGLTVMTEWLHSSKTYTADEILIHQDSSLSNNRHISSDYVGASAYYDFNLLYNGALSMIYSPEDQSSFISPLIEYSISDDASIAVGAMLYTGDNESEFGSVDNSYYLRLKATY